MWDPALMTRRATIEAGHAVVANMSTRSPDPVLIAWAENTGRLVYIGRAMSRTGLAASIWANPYKLRADATLAERLAVVDAYDELLAQRPELQALLPGLRGKVLDCWCYLLPCHGDRIVAALEAL